MMLKILMFLILIVMISHKFIYFLIMMGILRMLLMKK